MRGSHHLFCSENCLDEYSKNQTTDTTREDDFLKSQNSLVPGTPELDSAYSPEETPISIKNINFETFEAVQTVIEKTDREIKSYLKDLELIFESSNLDSRKKFEELLEGKWQKLGENLSEFKKSAENAAKWIENIEKTLLKGQFESSESAKKLFSAVTESSKEVESNLSESINSISASIESKVSALKEMILSYEEKLSSNLTGIETKITYDIADKFKGLSTQFENKLSSVEKSIDLSSENERKLLEKNELKVKSFLENEEKFINDLLTDYYKKLSTNLNSNKEKVSQTVASAGSEIKDFLDFQRNELFKSVENLKENLQSALQSGEGKIASTGADLSNKLDISLRESAFYLNKSLDSFEKGLSELLESNRTSIEDHLLDIETGQEGLLHNIEDNLSKEFAYERKEFESALKENSSQTSNNIGGYLSNQKEKLEKFVGDAFSNERAGLSSLFQSNQTALSESLDKISKDITESDLSRREALVLEVDKRLSKTSTSIEDFSRSNTESILTKLSLSLQGFEAKIREYVDLKGKIVLDEMAMLQAANKGNLEEVLNKNRVEIESQIKNVERESSKLLKTEITKSMDVFNLNLSSLLGEIKDNLKKKIKAIPTQFSLSPVIKTLIVLLFIVGITNPLILYYNFSKLDKDLLSKMSNQAAIGKDSEINTPEESAKQPAKIEQAAVYSTVIEKPRLIIRDNFTTTHEKISIKGESKFGDFAVLKVNGEPRSVRFITKGRFLFDDIDLASGENRLEVTAFTVSGSKSKVETKILFYTKSSSKVYNLAYNISRGDIRKPAVALTFDGGSNSLAAPFILSTLREKGIKCTIFLTGDFIIKNPDLTKKIAEDGHEVGNHTFSHPHLFKNYGTKYQKMTLSKKDFESELLRTRDLFKKTTGIEMAPFWRAPYGEVNDDVLSFAKNLGYTHVRWTTSQGKAMDSLDWVEAEENKLYRTAEEIKNDILSFDNGNPGGSNGSIIIMHLGTNRSTDQPYSKLGEIIDGMTAKGYQFVKVSDLMEGYRLKQIATNK